MVNTNKWAPVLETIGIDKSHKRFNDLCEYAEIQKNLFKANSVNESVNNANAYNTSGFGAVTMPGLSGTPGLPGTAGSGDVGQLLMPASIKIAAHAPGLNLLPVINVNSNRVDLVYHDWKYDSYATFDNAAQEERGETFKIALAATDITAIKTALTNLGVTINRGTLSKRVFFTLDGTTITPATILNFEQAPADKQGIVEITGFSKYDGQPIFRIFTQDNAASTGSWSFKPQLNTLPEGGTIAQYFSAAESATITFLGQTPITITGTPTLTEVSLNEDVIRNYSSNRGNTGMTRGEWDATTADKIAPDTFVKSVEIGVRHIAASLRISQIADFKRMHGIDIVAKTREQLITQMQQEISIEIVEKVKEMGEKNRAQVMALNGGQSIYDMNASLYTTTGNLFESSFSLTRKLWQKVRGGAFFIKSDGRWGAADYAIVSGTTAAILEDMKGYQALPFSNHQLSTGKSIEALGSIDGITIYVDPQMMPNDLSVYLGRVGAKDEPGLKFLAYMLAEQVEITSERTMAPHMYLYSRYAVTEFGFFPEKQYLAIHVTNGQNLIW